MDILWSLLLIFVLKVNGAPPHDKRHIIYEDKDVENMWAKSRPARNTDEINEIPEACKNIECAEEYEPVCGTDGLTHNNICKLKLAACYKPEDNLIKHYSGECREKESYMKKHRIRIDGDADGCQYEVINKVLPYGQKGYNKCVEMECLPDRVWHPTGNRLPNCDVGSVKCWNWVTNETVPLESTMDFECNQYTCTEDDWELSGERKTCGCFCVTTGEYLPHGFKGYYKCEEYFCSEDNTWRGNGGRLPGCTVGEMKCWDWHQDIAVDIASQMMYNDINYECTNEDWQKVDDDDVTSLDADGCISDITKGLEPFGTKGYYQCEQYECFKNKTWQKTGEKLPGCSEAEMKCLNWYSNDIVPIGSVMVHNCTEYLCSENDWEKTPKTDLPCLETAGCWSKITNEVVPYKHKGYYICEQLECMSDNTWQKTGKNLTDCSPDSVKCWDWNQGLAVPMGSTLLHNNHQYECTKEDWMIMTAEHAFDEADGCISEITKGLEPYGTKGYYQCEQYECFKNKTWQKTGEKLPGCSPGSVKCWNWNIGMAVPVTSTLLFNNLKYECTEEDWKIVSEKAFDDADGCISDITKGLEPFGTKGYYQCEQYECFKNKTWQKTGEKLPGCSLAKMKCLDWFSNEIVPIDSVMIHNCEEYKCSEFDWKKTQNMDKSCKENKKCISPLSLFEAPTGYKGYYKCIQYECTEEMEWKETGEKLVGCSDGKTQCWDWQQDEGVPLNSELVQDNVLYTCTENDWQKTILDLSSISQQTSASSIETAGCLSEITGELLPYEFKGYYVCEQFECLSDNMWHETGKNLSDCSPGSVKCWDWNQGMAVPIGSTLMYNNHGYECTDEDWTIIAPQLAFDEAAIVPEERFNKPCDPGVTSEKDGQQCCCSDMGTLECNGPCPDLLASASPRVDPCTPGENVTNENGQVCCCISEDNLDCSGPCAEGKMMDDEMPVDSETTTGTMGCSGDSCKEADSATTMGMEKTAEDSSSSKQEVAFVLLLLSLALLWL